MWTIEACVRRAAAAGLLGLYAVLASPAAHAEGPGEAETRALATLAAGDVQGARAQAERLVALDPARAASWVLLGYARSRAGESAAAIEAYRAAVRLDPRDARARNNLGALLIARGELAEGQREVEAALALEPAYRDALNNQGAALERQGRTREAQQAYERAAGRGRGHATALSNLGTLRWRAGDRDGAVRDWQRARQLDPALAEAGVNLLVAAGLGPDEALARLEAEAAREGAPASVRVLALRARAARSAAAQDWEGALALLQQAQRLTPWDARVLNDLAVAADQLGRDREALATLRQALELEPGLTVARNNLGIVQVHAGAPEAAAETFAEVLARDPRFHRAHYNLGVLQAAGGQLEGAERSFAEAARLAPTDAAARYNLALVRRQRGGSVQDEARGYEQALALDPALPEAHLALGMLRADPATPARLRDEAAASTHLQRFLELALPSDAEGRLQARGWLQWLAESR